MLSSRLVILAVLATSPALAQAPSAPISPRTAAVMSRRQHAPMRLHELLPNGAVTSDNWSGYAVTGSSFTDAEGSWKVPAANCSKTPNTYSAFWVGIDGYTSSSVEQTGTASDCDGSTPSYYAWYEFYPSPEVEITSVPISPGDVMSASVTYGGSNFTVKITNESTGKSYSTTHAVAGAKRSSAEWIAEAPCCKPNGAILPLADFAKASFGEDYTDENDTNYATDSSISGPISDFGSGVQKITMVNSKGVNKAVPSALTTDGTSFTVKWKHE